MTSRVLLGVMLVAVSGSSLGAQVGSTPESSPFRDLEIRQDLTVLAGPSFGGHDKAGAAPRGGYAIGARYDINLGKSPLAFTASVMRQTATRDILQPGQPLANRVGLNVSQPLWAIDGAFTLLLTGNRSWHSLVPSATFGGGIVTDNKAVTDSSQFKFGTRFAPLFGLGIKFAPLRSRWTVRADFTNRFYSVSYPQTFRDSTPNVPRILTGNTKSSWTRNTMLTLGLVREFGRR
ncbi:MAG: hypothetical protein H7099_17945 [Gemmatimonadaceae bacterium]|nr:hypothetical protein [Gemmatimonadaceae bacterium]